ncbi:MAG: hypothetical protein K9M10_04075 [Candidatus Pacebacteria bacterium]|nr:hypothetical protein [Candidatus Paceibacterota bacterium]MCF7857623.1 hypothetical protein [Candidatus Paceibacterota bacterium]
MKNLIRIGFFLFTLSVYAPYAYATDYNYLPADVGIKQDEALSALEYRLKTLEAQIANSPQVSIDTINARIKALEAERDTEKRYVTGLYGSYGIGNQLDTKLAEIDAKYDAQINELEDEKDEYESDASALAKAEKEAEQLRQQIIELQKQNIAQSEDYLDLLDEQSNSDTTVYTDADIYEGFMYMDSLPLEEASVFFGRVKASRPDVAQRITTLYDLKYPHGKVGTAQHDEYLESLPEATPIAPQTITSKPVTSPEMVAPTVETPIEATATSPIPEPVIEQVPVLEPIQESFVDKVVGFFKSLISWW